MNSATRDERPTTHAATTPAGADAPAGALASEEEPRRRPRRLGLDPAYVERGKAALAALEASAPDAGAGERIIHELVASQVALALAIGDTQVEVVARLGHFLNEPKNLVILARALRELTTLSNAVGRRIEGALSTASSLRAQRRLWKMGQS
jgi:hypothetical protein